jgi:hypothetical protein
MVMSNTVRWVAMTAALSVVGGDAAAQQTPARGQQPQPPQGQQSRETTTVSFSDPSRPGTLKLNVIVGRVTVRGTNRKDVSIEWQPRGAPRGGRGRPDPAAAAGLKRVTSNSGGFTLEQEANTNTIEISAPPFNRTDYEIQVPSRTNLEVSSVNDAIVVEGIEGELVINGVNGPVTLTNVTGSVVANTVHGKLVAVMTRVTDQKAMAFTSFHGDVDVTLPSSIKANLKLQSNQGDVFTNFDLDVKPAPKPTPQPQGKGRVRTDLDTPTYGSVNGGGVEFAISSVHGNVYVRKGP